MYEYTVQRYSWYRISPPNIQGKWLSIFRHSSFSFPWSSSPHMRSQRTIFNSVGLFVTFVCRGISIGHTFLAVVCETMEQSGGPKGRARDRKRAGAIDG